MIRKHRLIVNTWARLVPGLSQEARAKLVAHVDLAFERLPFITSWRDEHLTRGARARLAAQRDDFTPKHDDSDDRRQFRRDLARDLDAVRKLVKRIRTVPMERDLQEVVNRQETTYRLSRASAQPLTRTQSAVFSQFNAVSGALIFSGLSRREAIRWALELLKRLGVRVSPERDGLDMAHLGDDKAGWIHRLGNEGRPPKGLANTADRLGAIEKTLARCWKRVEQHRRRGTVADLVRTFAPGLAELLGRSLRRDEQVRLCGKLEHRLSTAHSVAVLVVKFVDPRGEETLRKLGKSPKRKS